MTDTAKRLVGPVLFGTANAVLYTVPAATTTILRSIHVSNGGAAAWTFSLSINGAASVIANQLFAAVSVGQNTALDWSGFIVLNAGDTLQGLANNAASVSLVVCGVEVT